MLTYFCVFSTFLFFYRIAIFGVESVPFTIVNYILYKNKTGGATETKGNGEQGVVIGQFEPKTKYESYERIPIFSCEPHLIYVVDFKWLI